VAYQLALPLELQGIMVDPDHVVNNEVIELTLDLSYAERPIHILKLREKALRLKKILLVKVLWNHHPVQDAIWESELEMRQAYPELFEGKF
jgi:hypothetical protein